MRNNAPHVSRFAGSRNVTAQLRKNIESIVFILFTLRFTDFHGVSKRGRRERQQPKRKKEGKENAKKPVKRMSLRRLYAVVLIPGAQRKHFRSPIRTFRDTGTTPINEHRENSKIQSRSEQRDP